MSSKPAQT